MKNIERYKTEVIKTGLNCRELFKLRTHLTACEYEPSCAECKRKTIEWLCRTNTEPTLTGEEAELLDHIADGLPYCEITGAKKTNFNNGFETLFVYHKNTCTEKEGVLDLPPFTQDTMFCGMELDAKYTAKELKIGENGD